MRHWRWLYRASACDSARSPVLAIVGERVVGQGGLVTVKLQRGDERREAVWMLDYAILPEYQRGIVGGALVTIASSCCAMRMAFLNERSWAMVDKMGWSTHFLTTAFQLPLRPERLPILQTMAKETPGLGAGAQVAGGAVRAVGRAIAMTAIDLDVLPANRETIAPFADATRSDALRARRSADFLHWRVLSHPHADRYIVLKSASVQAFLGDAIQDWQLIDSDFEMMFESEA